MMNARSVMGLAAGLAVAAGVNFSPRAAESAAPDFNEVLRVARENLAGATEASLNRAAVDGFLHAMQGRVELAAPGAAASAAAAPLAPQRRVFDGGIGYVRVGRVEAGLADEVAAAARELAATNPLDGLVLDLRFAGGADYAAAAAVVDLFLSREVPLLDAGRGMIRSQAKTGALRLPVVALVNGETAGAAEALAAVLRQTGAGLLMGGRTAGRAAVQRDFPLSGGHTLRVAVAPVRMGDSTPLAAAGVAPDIEVAVNAAEERMFYADPFAANGAGAAGAVRAARRPRVSEADLTREWRGETADVRGPPGAAAPALADAPLERAIDLLKGLAVARGGRF